MKINQLFIVTLLTSCLGGLSCSSDSEGENENGNNNNNSINPLETVINELETDGNFTQFVTQLKTVEVKDNSLTVFAIPDEVFQKDIVLTKDQVLRHMVAGQYNTNLLLEKQKIATLSGIELNIDFFSESNSEKIIYLNDIVLGKQICQKENLTVYTIDKMIPEKTTAPSSSDEDYKKWLADKLEGKWEVIGGGVKSYTLRFEGEGQPELITKEKLKGYENQCIFTFEREDRYQSKSVYGKLKITNKGTENPVIPWFGEKGSQDYYYWSLENKTKITITLRNNAHMFYDVFRSIGTANIHLDPGVGKLLVIGTNEMGFSVNPPLMYPSERDSTSFTFVKRTNRP